jgi:hypothetical protein
MTSILRPLHIAAAGAFLAGVLLVLGVTFVTGGENGEEKTAVAVASAIPTPRATATALAAVAPTPTSEPQPSPADLSPSPAPQPAAQGAGNPQPVPVSPTRGPIQPGPGYALIGAVWADESIPVLYCVNPANPPVDTNGNAIMSAEVFATAVRRAFQTWQDVSGAYIAFRYTGLCNSDPFNFRDQVNTIGWGWLFSTAIGATAPSATHGKFQRQSSQGQYYEADIVVDVRYAQSFDDEAEYVNRALPYVLLHEVGHFVGLDHSDDPCSIMKAVITKDPAVLCEVDANGARALYPE